MAYQTEPIGFHAGTELRDGSASTPAYEAMIQAANDPDVDVIVNEVHSALLPDSAADPYERLYCGVTYQSLILYNCKGLFPYTSHRRNTRLLKSWIFVQLFL